MVVISKLVHLYHCINRRGIAWEIKFNTTKQKRLTKRLMFGSLVLLSDNNFQDIYLKTY